MWVTRSLRSGPLQPLQPYIQKYILWYILTFIYAGSTKWLAVACTSHPLLKACVFAHAFITWNVPLPIFILLTAHLQPILQSPAWGLSPPGSLPGQPFPSSYWTKCPPFAWMPLHPGNNCHYVLPDFGIIYSWVCFLCWTKFHDSRDQRVFMCEYDLPSV